MLSALAAALITTAAPSAGPDPLSGPNAFRIVLDRPTQPVARGAKRFDVVYAQSFRPATAVRLQAPATLPFRALTLDRRLLGGAVQRIEVPASTPLLETDAPGVFCGVMRQQTVSSLLARSEVAVCFRDEDGNGAFDSAGAFQPAARRMRSPYEIDFGSVVLDWQPVRHAYGALAEPLPKGELRATYFAWNPIRLIGPGYGKLNLEVCVPQSGTGREAGKPLCGLLNWPGAYRMTGLSEIELTAPPGTPQDVAFSSGGLAAELSVTRDARRRVSVAVRSANPEGPALLRFAGAFRNSQDYSFQTSFFSIEPLDPAEPRAQAR